MGEPFTLIVATNMLMCICNGHVHCTCHAPGSHVLVSFAIRRRTAYIDFKIWQVGPCCLLSVSGYLLMDAPSIINIGLNNIMRPLHHRFEAAG
jgi:hypothetical protein